MLQKLWQCQRCHTYLHTEDGLINFLGCICKWCDSWVWAGAAISRPSKSLRLANSIATLLWCHCLGDMLRTLKPLVGFSQEERWVCIARSHMTAAAMTWRSQCAWSWSLSMISSEMKLMLVFMLYYIWAVDWWVLVSGDCSNLEQCTHYTSDLEWSTLFRNATLPHYAAGTNVYWLVK